MERTADVEAKVDRDSSSACVQTSLPELVINDVSKSFHTKDGDIKAIDDVSLAVYGGEFVSLIGPSGCGKTTLLRCVSGLEQDYEGDIKLDGNKIEGPGLDRGIVFQEPRLLPWLTVEANVTLGLSGSRSENRNCAEKYLDMVRLGDFIDAYPSELSGGMAQRVAIARALICQPKLLLLDEPLGALDAMTRALMQGEIERVWLAEKTTMLLVTHDIEEAIFLGDRVVIMGARPTSIVTIIPVNLPRPRDRSLPDFVRLRTEVTSIFHDMIGSGQE